MSGLWIKSFTDGTKEEGSDIDISKGKASWSKGRLDDIKHVTIFSNTRKGLLNIKDTKWHQFDKLVVSMAAGSHEPIRTHRVVQAKIKDSHVGSSLKLREMGATTFCYLVDIDPSPFGKIIKKISKEDIGLWVTLVIPRQEKPYITIAKRGQIK